VTFPLVCTSAASNRLAEVRLLARAVSAHHPGERLIALVVDGPLDGAAVPSRVRPPSVHGRTDGSFDRLCPADLGLAPRVYRELALCSAGDDLAACLVPALVAHLLAAGRPVVALSPSVALLAPLDDLAALAFDRGVVLVPRTARVLPDDGREPSTVDVLERGGFDPGIVAIGPRGRQVVDFWSGALRVAAVSGGASPAISLPALDLVPHLFGASVEQDPGIGVSAWNAHERSVTWSAGQGYRAHGSVLRLVDLEGFDPSAPHLLSARLARPRVLLSAEPALARLCLERARALSGDERGALAVAHVEELGDRARAGVGERLADGTPLDDRMRVLARRAIRGSLSASQVEPVPDPFDDESVARFHDWLVSPDPSDPEVPSVPRYLAALRAERRDLMWHFPRAETVDRVRFRDWAATHGLDEAEVPPALRAALLRSPWWTAPTGVHAAPPGKLRRGVVLAGYLRAESGVGEAARLALDAMDAAGVEVVPAVLGSTPSRQDHPFGGASGATPVADRRVNLVWTSADQLPGFASVVGPDFFAGRYTVGYWAWETDRLPDMMAASAALVDEIWVPSCYVRDAVAAAVDRPIEVFPHPIVAPPIDAAFDDGSLGIPSGYRFLFTYDFLSGFARKNPLGLLEAFTSAFRCGEGPVLVLKSVNGDRHLDDLERLRLAALGRSDVVVVDGYLTPGARGALLASCDCYVSLHRSEGFGLGLGEAMALAKPVIATAYSGNLDFMDDTTALLVPARRVEVGADAAPYAPTDHWGDPDLGEAATLMRRVAEDPGAGVEIGRRGREHVAARHGARAAGRFAARRLDEIESMLRHGYVSGAADAVRRLL